MRTLSALGKDALKDKAGLAEFVKTDVNPRLDALKTTSPEEEKIKAAAILVRTVFESQVDPSRFTKEELASIDAFLSSASDGEEAKMLGDKIGYVLIRYQEFVIGMTLEQMKQLQKK